LTGEPEEHHTELLGFFMDVNHQALDLELLLLSFILGRPNCPLDVTIWIVLVGLKVIAINVCVTVAVCN
jgi:hypothetical protein